MSTLIKPIAKQIQTVLNAVAKTAAAHSPDCSECGDLKGSYIGSLWKPCPVCVQTRKTSTDKSYASLKPALRTGGEF